LGEIFILKMKEKNKKIKPIEMPFVNAAVWD
jgi:hypothetical protein